MKRLSVALTVAGLALAGLGVAPLPANAAEQCTIYGFSPDTVIVGLSPTVVEFEPYVDDCDLEYWNIEGESFYAYDGAPKEVFEPYDNGDTKPQDVVVTAYNEDYDEQVEVYSNSFNLLRKTVWDKVNAGPEPVRKGSSITIKGRLRLANWETQRYAGYSGRQIDVEFRTADGDYEPVKTVKSGSGGYVSTKVKAKTDGYWRLSYGGNAIAGDAISVGDYVDVR